MALPPPNKEKLGLKTIDCVFIIMRTVAVRINFLCMSLQYQIFIKKTYVKSRNASFFEHIFPCRSIGESSSVKRTLYPTNDNSRDQEDEVVTELRLSKRDRMLTSFSSDFLTYILESEHQTYKEVVSCLEGSLWKETIKSEVDSILQNYMWELMDLT